MSAAEIRTTKPTSLYPLKFGDIVRDVVTINPPPKEHKPKQKTARGVSRPTILA
jgi:hypothetical protein